MIIGVRQWAIAVGILCIAITLVVTLLSTSKPSICKDMVDIRQPHNLAFSCPDDRHKLEVTDKGFNSYQVKCICK